MNSDNRSAEAIILEQLQSDSTVTLGQDWFKLNGLFSGDVRRAQEVADRNGLGMIYMQEDASFTFYRKK